MKYFLVALGVLILDQWSKWLVMTKLIQGQSVPLIGDILYITYVRNPGAAFGMLPYQTLFFIVITLLVMVGIVIFFSRVPVRKAWLKYGLSLQLGGAVGNLLDRIRFGHVIDFFDFRVWPVFNVADIGIVIGVCVLFLELIRKEHPPGKPDDSCGRQKTSSN